MNFFARIVTGPTKPFGSYTLAPSEATTLLVKLTATGNGRTLNFNTSCCGYHIRPNTPVDSNSCNAFSVYVTPPLSTAGSFDIHFVSENFPFAKAASNCSLIANALSVVDVLIKKNRLRKKLLSLHYTPTDIDSDVWLCNAA